MPLESILSEPPSWNAPAHLVGLPYTNWKRKTGFEMRGTLAECVQRALSLPDHNAQNITLTIEETPGRWNMASIRAHVAKHGAPPQMGIPLPERLKQLTEKQPLRATPPSPTQVQDGAAIAKGAGRG